MSTLRQLSQAGVCPSTPREGKQAQDHCEPARAVPPARGRASSPTLLCLWVPAAHRDMLGKFFCNENWPGFPSQPADTVSHMMQSVFIWFPSSNPGFRLLVGRTDWGSSHQFAEGCHCRAWLLEVQLYSRSPGPAMCGESPNLCQLTTPLSAGAASYKCSLAL